MTMRPPTGDLPRFSVGRSQKPASGSSSSSFWLDRVTYIGGVLITVLLFWCLWSFTNPTSLSQSSNLTISQTHQESSAPDFKLPDPRVGKPITNWDTTRQQYNSRKTLQQNRRGQDRILMITGSQPSPCKSPVGDHLLLRFFKNKVDYCRIHGCEIYYNNVLLQKEMSSYWAKYPVIRAAMITHPEVEWIWWVDSDAVITDMSFKLLLNRYANYNLVLQGWNSLIYGNDKKWCGANAGVFLIRNCQWSMDLMEKWSGMGPISPEYDKWGSIQKSVFTDKTFPESDDQTGLLYLLVTEKEKLGDKVFIEEKDVYFQRYWLPVMDDLKNQTLIEKWSKSMGERGPEGFDADIESAADIETEAKSTINGEKRRPFITHFTGCQPCSGNHNEIYPGDTCFEGMEMALNFADNQVPLNYGYVHPDLHFSSLVDPLPGL